MRIRFRFLCLATLLACAPRASSLGPDHPASANAPIGRLAGPPAALRPGVAETAPPTAPDPAPTGHEHHAPAAQPAAPSKPVETKEPAIPTEPEKTEPEKIEPKKTEPKKTEPKKTEPKKTEPKKTEPKKPETKPAPDPHEGHEHH